MNIDQWIETLGQADPPSEQHASTSQPYVTRKCGRGSKRSSLLEPFVDRVQPTLDTSPAETVCTSPSKSSSVARTTSSYFLVTTSSTSGGNYERKPRHRTKADKYHPKPKHKSNPEKKKREKKQGQSRCNRHKNKASRGLVQSFHAKNVSKNRLTLDGSKAGLYTKGRSSGPMKGQGLPDLVFSEMRFLQKPEHPVQETCERRSKKKHKRKHRQVSEEEISRFFDASKTQPNTGMPDQEKDTLLTVTRKAARRDSTASPVALDLPGKPFLGFGSRGTHRPTTSYLSWSESERASASRSKHFVRGPEPLAAGQLQGSWSTEPSKTVDVEQDTSQHRPVRQTANKQDGKGHSDTPKSSRHASQNICDATEPRQINDERTSERISNEHEACSPVALSQGNRGDIEVKNVHKSMPAERTVSSSLGSHQLRGVGSMQPAILHRFEPWEALLRDCEVAAQSLMPTQQHDTILRDSWFTPHEHTELRLWRTDEGVYSEHHADNTAFVAQFAYQDQPEIVEPWNENNHLLEGLVDDVSEFGDSHCYSDVPSHEEAEWEEGGARGQDEIIVDGKSHGVEGMDELAGFWQPNKLY